MRKGLLVFIISIFLCALFVSCSLEPVDENSSINHYIFPYVKFELSEDKTYYTASILEGARVANVYIPAYVENSASNTGSSPVKVFTGFESDNDIVNLNSITFESSITEIKLKSLDQASILETIHVKNIDKTTKESETWRNLPEYPHTSTREFVGWFTTDTDEQVHNGDNIDPEHMSIYAKYVDITLTHHEAVNPTCTEDGNIEYWQCDNCNLLFADSQCSSQITQVTISALGHATLYVEEKPAECEEKGIKAHWDCSRCHALFEDEKATKSTTLDDLTISALGHDWVYKHGEKISEGHWMECSRCQETKDAEPHDYSKKEVTKEPTHESVGTMTYICEECGATKTEDIAPIGDHIWVKTDTVVSPTCEERGYTVYKCTVSDCSATYNSDYVNPLGHKIETVVEAKEPTCTEAGNSKYYICSVCEKLFKDQNGKNPTTLEETKISALGHLYNEKVFENDTTYHWHKCTREGCDAITEKDAHDYKEKTTTYQKTEATCTEPATYYYTCVCGKKGTETFESGTALGHNLTHYEKISESCGEFGKKEYWQCSRCNKKYYDMACTKEVANDNDLIIPATGDHKFGSYTSWSSSGHRAQCSVCHKDYGELLSHDIDTLNWSVSATNHWHECKDCGYKTDEAKHSFVSYGTDEVCSVCLHVKAGKEETTDGGFDIKPETLEPTGKLTVEGSSGSFKATFTLDENSKMTSIFWLLDGVELDGETTCICDFKAPDGRTYHITCVVFNGSLVNSYDLTVIGGDN